MGYETGPHEPEQPLWEVYRGEFPVTKHFVYMNHAAIAPLVAPAAKAMRRFATDACEHGSANYSKWLETYEALREAAARLIGSNKSEIAIVKNTSEGIATVALGIEWREGDRVVAFREEFPANYYPWKRLEAGGVHVEWLSIYDSLERIDEAARGARLLSVSFVNYLSGHRVDLEAIGNICHRNDCFFFVDAIQGLGAFPVDVAKARIDALAADGHKWLLGPEGCGILYVRQEVQDRIEPVEFGWTNVAGYEDYASRDMTLRPDAGRYECGTLNTIGCFGLCASIEFLLGVGVENVAAAVLERAGQIAEGVTQKDYEVLGRGGAGSGIVTFRKEGVDSRLVVAKLREAGVLAAPRQGWVRTSPHFYIGPEDAERMLAALP